MPKLPEAALLAFHDELTKMGGVPWKALGGNVGSLMGTGAALGAAIGGVHSGLQGYRTAKEQGAGTGHALLSGVGHAVPGALQGGMLGAGSGALLGAAGTHFAPEETKAISEALAKTAPGRFGQRQVHAVTGWTPKEGLPAIKGDVPGEIGERNMTNLPGIVDAVRKDPVGATKAGLKHQWDSGDRLSKALMLGVPVLGAAGALASPEEHRGEMLGSNVGQLVGGALTAGTPLAGQLVGSSLVGAAGKYIGRAVDKARHLRPEHQIDTEGQHVPMERVISPAMTGHAEGA